MSEVQNARLFWEIVAQTLVRFYGFEESVARAKASKYMGSMTPTAVARNLVYHSQPLHIAAKIASVLEPINEGQLALYDKLVQRLTRAAEDELMPHAIAPRKARSAAA